jgi:hypothetical protein
VEFGLNVGNRQFHSRRASIDDAANRRPMGFAKGSNRKKSAKGIAGHSDWCKETKAAF